MFDIENNEFHGGCSRYFISKKIDTKFPKRYQSSKKEDDFGLKN